MSNFLKSLQNTGLSFALSPAEKRGVLLSNQINLILFGLGLILSIFYWVYYPPNVVRYFIPGIGILCLSFIAFNALGFTIVSRIATSLFVPLATMALSIYSKSIYYSSQIDLDYFTFRFIILGTSIVPAILFTTRERIYLISGLVFNFLLLMSHDLLHSIFGVSYIKNGLDLSSYHFTNVVIAVTYFILLGSILFLKINLERTDRKNQKLLFDWQQSNEELQSKNEEIEAQHQEMLAQSEKLSQHQNQLLEAYTVIENQKELLARHNKNLETELIEKNKDLSEANTELIKYNNELRQFSYTISHNLRGPVASLLGLLQLFNRESLTEENRIISDHIFSSANRLDGIIKDLNKIIDIRNDIFKIRQKISLADELKQIQLVLQKDMEPNFISLETDITNCSDIYSVRPMVHSILYNLISNAIKYRAPERKGEIRVSTNCTNNYYIFTVEDNGLGIDLVRHQENLFKLYKRFHYHTEGKGVGLYLVKLQCEALGGYVEVSSELNRFTRFVVYLKKAENIERQILYDQGCAKIFFDASINATGISWKGPVSSEEYREVFIKSLELVKAFNTPNYVSDISHQGPISEEDQHWMFQTIIPDAVQSGLKRICSIKPGMQSAETLQYLEGTNQALQKHGVAYRIFGTMDEGTEWLRKENEAALLTKN